MIPVKRILSPAHLKAFQESQTHKEIVEFIEELNASVNGVKLSEAGEGSPVSMSVLIELCLRRNAFAAYPVADLKRVDGQADLRNRSFYSHLPPLVYRRSMLSFVSSTP